MAPKMTKNQMRRAKKKEQKKTQVSCARCSSIISIALTNLQVTPTPEPEKVPEAIPEPAPSKTDEEDEDPLKPEIEQLDINEDDPNYAMFKDILGRFTASAEEEEAEKEANAGEKGEVFFGDDDDIPDEDEEADKEVKLSKKKRKERDKLSVAELKALVQKPELVDWTDTSASDPRLLVHIKSYRNVVPVPSHWSLKREYLSSKRGVEKAPFSLPKFIQETGIAEMRDAVLEKQADASLKQSRENESSRKWGNWTSIIRSFTKLSSFAKRSQS